MLKNRFLGTAEVEVKSIVSEVGTSKEVKNQDPGPHDGAAVHCKPRKWRETQVSLHTGVQQDDPHQEAHDWRYRVQLSDRYAVYNEDIIGKLTKFLGMWDGHLAFLNDSRYRIEHLKAKAGPVNQALFRTGPKKRKFVKTRLSNWLPKE